MEEFHPTVVHVASKDNDAADALSRLDIDENGYDDMEWGPLNRPLTYSDELTKRINLLFPANEERELNHRFPLAPELIKFYQDQDPSIQEDVNTREHTLTTRIPSFFSYRISTHNTHITIILVFGSTMHIKMDTVIPDCSCCCC